MPKMRLTFHQIPITNHESVEIDIAEGGQVGNFETSFVGTSGVEPEWLLRYLMTEPVSEEDESDG